MIKHFCTISLLSIIATSVLAADEDELSDLSNLSDRISSDWQIVKMDKVHNITTYYKHEDGKKYRSFRVEAVFDNSFDATACHRVDINNYLHWFMNISESKIIKRVSDTEFFMYMKLRGRLGVPARDAILHVMIQPYNYKRGNMTITYRASPQYIPLESGVIRMPVYESVTKLVPLENGKTIEYTEGYAEPGGAAPAWLVNYLQRQMPYANSLGRWRDIARYEDGKIACPFKYKD
jgi:hypothetical protein